MVTKNSTTRIESGKRNNPSTQINLKLEISASIKVPKPTEKITSLTSCERVWRKILV